MKIIIKESSDIGSRIDVFLKRYLEKENILISRGTLEKLIPNVVTVNDKTVKKGYALKSGDVLELSQDELQKSLGVINAEEDIEPIKYDLQIIDENEDYLIINKPRGVAVHPSIKNNEGTIANYVKYYLLNKGEYDVNIRRGGIVHRLDKGVGGLMLVAKNRKSQLYFQKEFEERRVVKLYWAKVKKDISDHILLEKKKEIQNFIENNFEVNEDWIMVGGYISRDPANRMRMKINALGKGKSVLSYLLPLGNCEYLITIKTGRMHQIRASFFSKKMVIIGDRLYGDEEGKNILELFECLLCITLPSGEKRVYTL